MCPGRVPKGGPNPDVCLALPPRHVLSNWEFWSNKDRRPKEAGRPKGLKHRDALEVKEPRPCSVCPPTSRRARVSYRPQATGAATAASDARCAKAAAVHWCGTTIGTSLHFCLQSNPAIKRGTKSPLITPCHKVICPRGKS